MLKTIELCSFRIDVMYTNQLSGGLDLLGPATTTLLEANDGSRILVSNWHVFTGRRPNDPRISRLGAVPTHFRLRHHVWEKAEGINDEQRTLNNLDLRTLDIPINSVNGENPLWIEDPFASLGVDLAAIPVDFPEDSAVFPANKTPGGHGEANHIGQTIMIVGFPEGLTGITEAMPICKTGHIDTNPKMRHRGHSRFIIDARTYRGMSGSPVFSLDLLREPTFLGIYSGRLSSPEGQSETELGYCWFASRCESLINGHFIEASLMSKVSDFAGAKACKDEMIIR